MIGDQVTALVWKGWAESYKAERDTARTELTRLREVLERVVYQAKSLDEAQFFANDALEGSSGEGYVPPGPDPQKVDEELNRALEGSSDE